MVLKGSHGCADYFRTSVSYPIAILANLPIVLQALSSYLLILLAFVTFVIWNGGVVLGTPYFMSQPSVANLTITGDKNNHIATVHVAQMLYIWPYIAFFSLPLLYSYFLNLVIPRRYLPTFARLPNRYYSRPNFLFAASAMIIMVAIVRYNTIIHPFTLADNRHYTFYVFRLLLKHPSIRYLVIPVYFICSWAEFAALAGSSRALQPDGHEQKDDIKYQPPQKVKTSKTSDSRRPRTSWLLVWLATTTLSLSTASLVEPRYSILPWMMWRMQLLTTHQSSAQQFFQSPADTSLNSRRNEYTSQHSDARKEIRNQNLWLETAWFITINAVTGYIFLYRGFTWPQEPGKVQRFMW